MNKRGSGILLHITSLPSSYGIGDLGSSAYKFVDFLSETFQTFWQILPLNPSEAQRGYSPYSTKSSFACNRLLINPEMIVEAGYLSKSSLHSLPDSNPFLVSYSRSADFKDALLDTAFRNALKSGFEKDYSRFCKDESYWLEDHALFETLSSLYNQSWDKWPEHIRDRHPDSLSQAMNKYRKMIEKEKFIQYLFYLQWKSLRKYCHQKGIQIIGDLPMFVSYDSADVWANRELFKLDSNCQPLFFAGVPPDRFSPTGQLWHNPVYDWEVLKSTGYKWWIRRFKRTFDLYDIVRIDHFRGLVAYWEIPANNQDATIGTWQSVPVNDFFNTLYKHFFYLPVIAEDLGTITPDVQLTMRILGFPGTKVLLFAFDNDDPMHPYRPHVFPKNCLACTSNHDTNTVRGWFETEASDEERKRFINYAGCPVSVETAHLKMIQLSMMSPADMVIFPLQDVLGLGKEARMNVPGTRDNNWRWRFTGEQITDSHKSKLAEMTIIYGRK